MEAYHVDHLSACACCPEVFKEIVEVNVLEYGGLIFYKHQPRFFYAGEEKFLSHELGSSDGRLEIKLAGPFFLLA